MQIPSPSDLAWVRRFRRAVTADLDGLCGLLEEELERERFESMTADIVPLLQACRWTERNARKILKTQRLRGGGVWQLGQRHRVHRVPIGRVGIIATWNYPVQLLGIQLVHAVVAGNRVVVKPSERSPRTHARLLELARSAGLDSQRLRWTEATREAGRDLIEAGGLDHLVFTGSTEVGRTIAGALATTLTPSTLELSGCDSAIVLSDADPRLAAESVGFALALNRGQTCMAPRRVIVHRDVLVPFLSALADDLRLRGGPATLSDGDRPLIDSLSGSAAEPDEYGPAVVVRDCPPDSPLARGEHFSPILAVIPADSDEQAIELHARYAQRLATSVFTRGVSPDPDTFGSGVVTINNCVIPTGHPGLSIGGAGPSGWGLSRGEAGLLAMTRPVFVSRSSSRFRIPTKPPSPGVRRAVERFVRKRYG